MSFTQNPFALLADDGDASGDEQPRVSNQAQAGVAPAAGNAASSGRNTAASGAGANATAAGGKGIDAKPARRTVPGQQQASRPPRSQQNQPNGDNPAGTQATSTDGPAFEGERGRDDRGTGFGRGGGRGAATRGGRGDNKDRRRGAGERRGGVAGVPSQRLDRRSATGRVDSDKVEHQAWGGDDGKRELEAENAGVSDAAAEKGADTEGAVPSTTAAPADGEAVTETAAPAAPEKPVEPEDNTVSYEEYLKQRSAASRGVLDTLQIAARKVNEGQDEGQWKNAKLVEKAADVDAYHLGAVREAAGKAKERKQKTLLETEFTTPGPRQSDRGERGGRGGRGRGEGRGAPRGAGRGRGAGAGGRGGRGGPRANGQASINVDDSSAFPSLS